MEPRKGFYSLVQFCPDLSRMEAANVGVVLFVPEARFIEARMARSNKHVARLLGSASFDPEWLNEAKASFESRLETTKDSFITFDDLVRFAETRANKLVLTHPRPVKVYQPEEDLEKLFAELVGHPERPERRSPLMAELRRAFRRPTLAGRIKFNQKINIPVVNRPLAVPFAYQNSALHLVKPVAFGANPMPRGFELATEGDLIQNKSQAPSKLIIVPDLSSQDPSRSKDARKVLTELFSVYHIRTVWQEELPTFIQQVEREAHPIAT